MKIKLFTHTDFDGISCGILGILAFGKESIDIEYCDYSNINEQVENFYIGSEKNKYDIIFITDISVNNDVATIIDYYKDEKYYPKTVLLDHHPTALELNKYDWAKVEAMLNDKEKTSGTRMFYDWLLNSNILKIAISDDILKNVKDFVEIVRKYDVWQWKAENDLIPKQWNDLFYIMGRNEFIESIIYRLKMYNIFGFCDFDLKLLKYKQRDIDSYIESKNKQIIVKNILGHKAGIIFGEQYCSELGNKLCELHPELDFIVIIDMSSAISYRSIGDKLDLGNDVAKVYGGGGHMNAAGNPINNDIRNKVLSLLFNK
jgi:oligoribonuclease NrnB/cAMP/cGMP phosphodiesterase (DHH superfamily)